MWQLKFDCDEGIMKKVSRYAAEKMRQIGVEKMRK